eukprot:gene8083-12544_t
MSKPRRPSLLDQFKNLAPRPNDDGAPKSPLSPKAYHQFLSTLSQATTPEKMKVEVEKLEPQNKEKKKDILTNIELLKEEVALHQEMVDASILLYRKKLRDLEIAYEKATDEDSQLDQYNRTAEMKVLLNKGIDDKKLKKVFTSLKTITDTVGDWRDEISFEHIKLRQTIVMKSVEDFHINTCIFTPDNRYIIIGLTGQNSLQIYSTYTGRFVKSYNNLMEIHSLCISADGKTLYGGSIGTIGIWNLQTFEFVKTLTGHSKEVSAIALTPDGKYLISGDKNSNDDSHVIVWDLQTFDVYTQIDQLGKVKSINSLKDSKSFLVETESLSNPTYIMRYQPNGEKLNHIKVDKIVSGVLMNGPEIIYGESPALDEPGLCNLNFLTISGKIDQETTEKSFVQLNTGDIEKLAKNEKGDIFATSSKSENKVMIWSKEGKELSKLEVMIQL